MQEEAVPEQDLQGFTQVAQFLESGFAKYPEMQKQEAPPALL